MTSGTSCPLWVHGATLAGSLLALAPCSRPRPIVSRLSPEATASSLSVFKGGEQIR